MKLKDFPDIQTLSANDKLQLVDKLLISVAPELMRSEVSEAEQGVLEMRWNSLTANPNSALSEEELKSKVDVLLK